MSDLISKKQLVDLAYSGIDSIDQLYGKRHPDASDWEYAVENVPTVDAEIVIHCKECIHNGSYDTDCPITWPKSETAYCSFGEVFDETDQVR